MVVADLFVALYDNFMPKQENVTEAADPIGWYVRVTTAENYDGVYNTILYIAGFATPTEAEHGVRQVRRTPTGSYEVLPEEITSSRGPQPTRGEVRLLNGVV